MSLNIKETSFQQIIIKLNNFWQEFGCTILQPIDSEVGAGTLHNQTIFGVIAKNNHKIAYPQLCKRPCDLRYGKNPNRIGNYYQYQVLIKPFPQNIKAIYMDSLRYIGLEIDKGDLKFIEDDWENPTVGASGIGWEIWFNSLEITQFTYMQMVGSIDLKPAACEITYGLERIVKYIQNKDSIFDINYNGQKGEDKITYGDLFKDHEYEESKFTLEEIDNKQLFSDFNKACEDSLKYSDNDIPIIAYRSALKASHILNLIDANNLFSTMERANYISKVRNLVRKSCEKYLELYF